MPVILYCNRKIKTDYPGIADLAPTVLDLFGVQRPAHIDGISLFDEEDCARRVSRLDAYFTAGIPDALREQLAGSAEETDEG